MPEATARDNLMLFLLGDETQAVSADCVTRVIPTPALRAFPLMPQGFAGMVAIAGKVVPVIDLPVHEGREMVLAKIAGDDYAFRVDKALRLVAAGDSQGAEARALDLNQLVRHAEPSDLSAEPQRLALDATAPASPPENSSIAPPSSAFHAAALAVETESSRHLLSLSFVVELKENLPITELQELSPLFGGAAFYRDDLIPVICLQALIGGARVDRSSWGAFIVAALGGCLCALAVKRIVGLSANADGEDVVDLKMLLDAAIPESHRNRAARISHEIEIQAEGVPYLLVEIAAQTCAFPLSSVVHIHNACRMIDAPTTPAGVLAGIAAIGGRVLPVLDLYGLLGLPEPNTSQFLELKTQQTGAFLVAVEKIIGIAPIAQAAMLRAPDGIAIGAITKIETKLVWILEPAIIVERAGWSAHAA